MRILLIKTSSLGDIIHTFPALTDVGQALGDVRVDWVVEEGFASVPAWHPLVDTVIPVAWRRWRKAPFSTAVAKEWRAFYRQLRTHTYDLVLDAQGLIKSALLG